MELAIVVLLFYLIIYSLQLMSEGLFANLASILFNTDLEVRPIKIKNLKIFSKLKSHREIFVALRNTSVIESYIQNPKFAQHMWLVSREISRNPRRVENIQGGRFESLEGYNGHRLIKMLKYKDQEKKSLVYRFVYFSIYNFWIIRFLICSCWDLGLKPLWLFVIC